MTVDKEARMNLEIPLSALALAAVSLPISAAQLAFDDGGNLVRAAYFSALPPLPPFEEPITLPTFDTSLGTLTGATLSWFSTLTLAGEAVDGNHFPAAFEFTSDGSLEVFATTIDVGPLSVADFCVGIGCDILGVEVVSTSALLNLAGELDLFAEAAVQTAGPGSFDVTPTLSAALLGPDEFNAGSFTASWDITATVTYDFVPVPLPPAWALLGAAILTLRVRARKYS